MNTLTYRFYYILAAGWRQRYVIIIPILILPFMGLLTGVLSPKNYSSHTSMLIQETAKMNPFLEDLAVSAMLKERMDALKTLLHSRHILGTVAEQRGLINKKTTAEKHDEIIAELSDSLSVKMLGKDLIRIDYTSNIPEGMKNTLEIISDQFVEQLLAPERSSMADSSRFLTEHLEQRKKELDIAEEALAKFKSLHASELPEMHLTNITHLTKLKERLSEREAEMAGAVRRLGGLDQQLSKTNPVLGRIEEQIVNLRGQLALLRARYTDKHSNIQAALRNLRRLQEERQNILQQTEQSVDIEQLWAIASNTQINIEKNEQTLLVSQLENLQHARGAVDSLKEETKSLKEIINKLQKKTENYGKNENDFSRLERNLKVKRELYDDLLLRYENARITSSLGIFERDKRIKIIDQPFKPTSPDNLPLSFFILAGLVGGIFVGCGLALLIEISDTSMRRRDQLQSLTGAPVISRIPTMVRIYPDKGDHYETI